MLWLIIGTKKKRIESLRGPNGVVHDNKGILKVASDF
jgi:hypothetical protein